MGKFRVAIVGPETAKTTQFSQLVHSQDIFRNNCICKVVDEAHAVTEWGTDDFRPAYAEIGILRTRLRPGTPILAASATLPDSIIRDLQHKLGLDSDSARIMVSNAKPNVALSVRIIKYPEDTLADLLALIPPNAATPDDIPMTIIYVNGRTDAEDIQDALRAGLPSSISPDVVEFYHRSIEDRRKNYVLNGIHSGKIRIVPATDALGWVSPDVLYLCALLLTENVRLYRVLIYETSSELYYGKRRRHFAPSFRSSVAVHATLLCLGNVSCTFLRPSIQSTRVF